MEFFFIIAVIVIWFVWKSNKKQKQQEIIQQAAAKYLIWVVIGALISVWAFQLDGIFIGATRAKEMRNAMFLSFFAYLLCILVLVPIFENHGLWLAFLIFLSFRGITLGVRYPRLERELT